MQAFADEDVVVDIDWSGISTGTERLLWTGRMPPFPGMGYPLVPDMNPSAAIVEAGAAGTARIGQTRLRARRILLQGCARPVRRRRTAADRAERARDRDRATALQEQGVLIALAATAQHAIAWRRERRN